MKKKIGIILVCTLLITYSLFMANPIKSLKVIGNTLYVGGNGPENYTRIQDAINASSNGDTIYVFSGVYTENIVINKQIMIIGQNKNNTIIDGNRSDDVVLITSDFVSIGGFTIQNSGIFFNTNDYDCGIDIKSNLNTVFDNIISNNLLGIRMQGTYANNLSRNILTSNSYFSIQISSSYNNSIIFNNISNNPYGLYINDSSNNNVISNNLISNNSNKGIQLFHECVNNIIIENKIISNREGICLVDFDSNNTIKDNLFDSNSDSGISIHGQCSNNIITYNNVRNNGYFGIYNYNNNNNNISNNIIENNKGGIKISLSSNTTIFHNILINDYIEFYNSYQTKFVNNTINYNPILYLENKNNLTIDDNYAQIILISCDNISLNNLNIPFGILLLKSTSCSIINNSINAEGSIGITLYSYSSYNLIEKNNISNNKGIHLHNSHNNIFLKNRIINCSRGFYLDFTKNNTVSHNYVHNNKDGIIISSGKNCSIKNNFIANNEDSGILLDNTAHNISIFYNYISNNGNGIYTKGDSSSNILYNYFNSNTIGINSVYSRDATISFNYVHSSEIAVILNHLISGVISDNNISNNQMGIKLSDYKYRFSNENGQITRNNFINNTIHAMIVTTWNYPTKRHSWNNNYWDNYLGFGKKSIPGKFYIILFMNIWGDVVYSFGIPWIFYDKSPVKEPYDIPIPDVP